MNESDVLRLMPLFRSLEKAYVSHVASDPSYCKGLKLQKIPQRTGILP